MRSHMPLLITIESGNGKYCDERNRNRRTTAALDRMQDTGQAKDSMLRDELECAHSESEDTQIALIILLA